MPGRQSRVQSMGKGRGRRGDFGLGPGGECVCPICKHSMPHKIGNPCNDHRCPQCGTIMERGATVSNDI
jgi:hypothetical protein